MPRSMVSGIGTAPSCRSATNTDEPLVGITPCNGCGRSRGLGNSAHRDDRRQHFGEDALRTPSRRSVVEIMGFPELVARRHRRQGRDRRRIDQVETTTGGCDSKPGSSFSIIPRVAAINSAVSPGEPVNQTEGGEIPCRASASTAGRTCATLVPFFIASSIRWSPLSCPTNRCRTPAAAISPALSSSMSLTRAKAQIGCGAPSRDERAQDRLPALMREARGGVHDVDDRVAQELVCMIASAAASGEERLER